ncbi:UNVERIFIED_CONTAM: hypothetical protein HDU68_006972, partial [Siphonaria sp. JEL0065]
NPAASLSAQLNETRRQLRQANAKITELNGKDNASPAETSPFMTTSQSQITLVDIVTRKETLTGNPLQWTGSQTAYWASTIAVVGRRFYVYLTGPTNGQGMTFQQINMMYTVNRENLKDTLVEANITGKEVDDHVVPAIEKRHGQIV